MKTLNRHNLKIAKLASKEETDGGLCYLKVEGERTIACDGYKVIEVSRPDVDEGDLPEIPDFEAKEEKPFFISKIVAEDLVRQLSRMKNLVPIFNNVFVSQKDDGLTELVATDLEDTRKVVVKEKKDTYPDIEPYKPKGKPQAKVNLGIKHLKEIVDMFYDSMKEGRSYVGIEIFQKDPVVIRMELNTGQIITALLMPVLDPDEVEKQEKETKKTEAIEEENAALRGVLGDIYELVAQFEKPEVSEELGRELGIWLQSRYQRRQSQ